MTTKSLYLPNKCAAVVCRMRVTSGDLAGRHIINVLQVISQLTTVVDHAPTGHQVTDQHYERFQNTT